MPSKATPPKTIPAGAVRLADSGRSSILIDIQSNLSRLVTAMETVASRSVSSYSDIELQKLQLTLSQQILVEMQRLTILTTPDPPLTTDQSNVTGPGGGSRPEPSRD